MYVTIFNNFWITKDPQVLPIEEVFDEIKKGSKLTQDKLNFINSLPTEEEQQEAKKQLRCILFNGEFKFRAKKGLVKHSGICITDYDGFSSETERSEVFNKLKSDRHTLFIFKSPRGGIKCGVLIPESNGFEHNRRFKAYSEYINIPQFDHSNCDVSRICYMSIDPDLWYNKLAIPFQGIKEETINVTKYDSSLAIVDQMDIFNRVISNKYSTSYVPGQRNTYIYTVACMCCEYGIDQEVVIEHFKKIDPDVNRLEVTVENAYAKTNFRSKMFEAPPTAASDFGIKLSEMEDPVFIPTWDNQPPPRPSLLTLNGINILSYQNTTLILANPGDGKSSVCDAIAASQLDEDIDCLGFKVSKECKGIIYVDFERSNDDVWRSFWRVCDRGGLKKGEVLNDIVIAGMRSVYKSKDRVARVEKLLDENPCSILILDGAGDLVTDTNDLEQAIACRTWFRKLTVKYKVSIVTTLHFNKGTQNARGHIGSELLRECENVLSIVKKDSVHTITSDFAGGKNRNSGVAEGCFKWSDIDKKHVSLDPNINRDAKVNNKIFKLSSELKEIYGDQKVLSYSEIEDAYLKILGLGKTSASKRIRESKMNDLIKLNEEGKYDLSH